jgi:hypothetical protein
VQNQTVLVNFTHGRTLTRNVTLAKAAAPGGSAARAPAVTAAPHDAFLFSRVWNVSLYPWSYEEASGAEIPRHGSRDFGPLGPSRWHLEFPECNGRAQSPMDIVTAEVRTALTSMPLRVSMPAAKAGTLTISNNGRAIVVDGAGLQQVLTVCARLCPPSLAPSLPRSLRPSLARLLVCLLCLFGCGSVRLGVGACAHAWAGGRVGCNGFTGGGEGARGSAGQS